MFSMDEVFSMGEVVSYFTANGQWKLNDISIPTMFPHMHKEKKKRKKNDSSSRKMIQAFLKTSLVAVSENEHAETKLLHMTSRLNKCYL